MSSSETLHKFNAKFRNNALLKLIIYNISQSNYYHGTTIMMFSGELAAGGAPIPNWIREGERERERTSLIFDKAIH